MKIYVIYYYMKYFRDPNYVERYEDVIFDLETALNTTVANNAHQRKKMATDLLSITVVRLHHLTGIMPKSVSISK